jgi:sarcosine oxidase
MGSATLYQLAARGVRAIGIDQFTPPHCHGSTHGDTRISRLAVGEGLEYAPLVRRSHELWADIARDAGVKIFSQTGGIVMARPESKFLARTREVARDSGIKLTDLNSGELRRRLPMFTVADDTDGVFEPTAGYVRPEAAVSAQLELARALGALTRLNERVVDWSSSAEGVRVVTPTARYEAEQLILCAGPWIRQLFPEGQALFRIHRQLLYWFPITTHFEQLARLPVFIWDLGTADDSSAHPHSFYGFPAIDGPTGGLKLATESYDSTTVPDGAQHPATEAEINQMYRDVVAQHISCLGSRPLRTVSCLYTCTPDSRFVIDRHPGHERVLIVSPCSGHGFKHSAAIGEAVAEWVATQRPPQWIDLGAFSFAAAE